MKPIDSLRDLLLEQLKDRYDAARQQAEAYPKLARAAANPALKDILEGDIISNQSHLDQLTYLFDKLSATAGGERCEGTQGLLHEADELLAYSAEGDIRDIGIAMSIQHVNHHDIAGYTSCVTYARAARDEEAAGMLQQMLDEENATDEALKEVIAQMVDTQAVS